MCPLHSRLHRLLPFCLHSSTGGIPFSTPFHGARGPTAKERPLGASSCSVLPQAASLTTMEYWLAFYRQIAVVPRPSQPLSITGKATRDWGNRTSPPSKATKAVHTITRLSNGCPINKILQSCLMGGGGCHSEIDQLSSNTSSDESRRGCRLQLACP